MSIEPKRKRKRANIANKRWIESEEFLILNYLLDLAPKNKEFEKPNKTEFYQKMTMELQLSVSHWSQTMNKVKNMRSSYVKAVDWKSNTGQGVEKGTIKEYIKQMCPYFDTLEEIFGHKTNVVSPFIYESGSANDQQIESLELGMGIDDDEGTLYNKSVDVSIRRDVDHGDCEVTDDDNYAEYLVDLDDFNLSDTLENDNSETVVLMEDSTISEEGIASSSATLYNVSEKSRFKPILGTAPPTSNATSNSTPTQKVDKENISRFKKRLIKSPVAEKDKTMSRNSSSILADAQNKKAEAILGRNEIERIRAENEKLYKLEEVSLAKEKFSLDKEIRKSDLELRKMEMDLRAQEIESRERIEMHRIEVEAKNNLEIAKLRQNM